MKFTNIFLRKKLKKIQQYNFKRRGRVESGKENRSTR